MMHKKFLAMFAMVAILATSCDKSDDEEEIPPPDNTTLQGTLTENMRLTADKKWTLLGYVYVPDGVTLTIDEGTVIVGSTTAEKAALCVERGGKLIANGTKEKPIVFTSGQPAGQRAPGDWGGVVLLGKAPTNRSATPVIEGGLDRPYGGTDAADASGSLKFVRIEFAGVAAFAGSEINGLTLGGVGTGTTLENIQVSFGNDDGYEFFGGTVNGKNLISYASSDDDFDFDFGYTGKIQYGIVVKDPNTVDNGDDNNGIECDNDGSGTDATPFTKPDLSNFTFVGPNNASTNSRHKYGNRFRRASTFSLRNSIIMGYNQAGFAMESDATVTAYKNGVSAFKNNLVHAVTNPYLSGAAGIMTSGEIQTKAESEGCITYASPNDIQLKDPFNISAPNLMPDTGSPALTGADFTGLDAFFTAGTFRGALGTTNWLEGWTSFSPKTNVY